NIVQLLPAGADGTFFRGAGQIIPRFGGSASGAGPASAPPASMALPAQANGAFDLRDVASGLAVTVSLRGTTDASVEVSDGYLVYPAAYEGGADLVNRPYPSSTEQSLAFAAKPDAEQITYDVALGPGVQGVRLVANTVEFLDGQGAPRLRMAPPFIAGSQSTSAWPSVGVQGCAVDTSPAPPWNRPVVVPGGTHCIVTVDWSQSSLQYPALLDPTWSVGSTMAVARMHHGGARVTASGNELALVFGGYAFTSTVASAELFDEATGTWAQTGNLVTDVSYAPAVALANGTALAVGGFRVTAAGGVETDSVQVYSPTTGTWSLQGHLGSARGEHRGTLLGGGTVLVGGGSGRIRKSSRTRFFTTRRRGWRPPRGPCSRPAVITARRGSAMARCWWSTVWGPTRPPRAPPICTTLRRIRGRSCPRRRCPRGSRTSHRCSRVARCS